MYNLNIERSILASVIFDPAEFEVVASRLKADDFYLPFHQSLFRAMAALEAEEKPIEDEFIRAKLMKEGKFDEIAMLDMLSANPITALNHYIDELKAKSKKRIMTMMAYDILNGVKEENYDVDDIIDEFEALEDRDSDDIEHIEIEDLMSATYPPTEMMLTGVGAIDNYFKGIGLGYLYTINGRPGAGKSTLSLQMMSTISKRFKTMFVSLEMNDKLVQKIFHRVPPPSSMTIDFKSFDITDITRSIKRGAKNGVRVVLIDSLMQVRNNALKGASRTEQLTDIANRLLELKNKLDITIILIVQASKENQNTKSLTVKGSGDVEYIADVNMQIYKEDEDEQKRVVGCSKSRLGIEGKTTTKVFEHNGLFQGTDGYFLDDGLPITGNSDSKKGVLE